MVGSAKTSRTDDILCYEWVYGVPHSNLPGQSKSRFLDSKTSLNDRTSMGMWSSHILIDLQQMQIVLAAALRYSQTGQLPIDHFEEVGSLNYAKLTVQISLNTGIQDRISFWK